MAYTDLVTISDLDAEALATFDAANNADAAERAISAATRRIEGYLNRTLIVREVVQRQRYIHLRTDYSVQEDAVQSFGARQYPALQVISVDPASVNVELHPDETRLYAADRAADIRSVSYFAGYRRSDHTDLSTLQADSGTALDTLTVLPPVLPADIREVAVNLTLHHLRARRSGIDGFTNVEQQVGTRNTTTVTNVRAGYVNDELQRLQRFRYLRL
jgi:hypothetical protein